MPWHLRAPTNGAIASQDNHLYRYLFKHLSKPPPKLQYVFSLDFISKNVDHFDKGHLAEDLSPFTNLVVDTRPSCNYHASFPLTCVSVTCVDPRIEALNDCLIKIILYGNREWPASSVIEHFSFQRFLNLGNLWKPQKTRKHGDWETYVSFSGNLMGG